MSRRAYTPMHVNRCAYCLLAGNVRQEYEWAKERLDRVRYSDNADDMDYASRLRRDVNLLGGLVSHMDRRLDGLHDQANW